MGGCEDLWRIEGAFFIDFCSVQTKWDMRHREKQKTLLNLKNESHFLFLWLFFSTPFSCSRLFIYLFCAIFFFSNTVFPGWCTRVRHRKNKNIKICSYSRDIRKVHIMYVFKFTPTLLGQSYQAPPNHMQLCIRLNI